jgi:hypothetical protein
MIPGFLFLARLRELLPIFHMAVCVVSKRKISKQSEPHATCPHDDVG